MMQTSEPLVYSSPQPPVMVREWCEQCLGDIIKAGNKKFCSQCGLPVGTVITGIKRIRPVPQPITVPAKLADFFPAITPPPLPVDSGASQEPQKGKPKR